MTKCEFFEVPYKVIEMNPGVLTLVRQGRPNVSDQEISGITKFPAKYKGTSNNCCQISVLGN